MNKKIIIPLSILIISLFSANTFAAGKIGIIVNKHLYPSIQTSVDMYINDVKNIEGKDVWLNGTTFDESNDKKELRDSLSYYYSNDDLEGAILIGDLPMCDFLTDETFERDIFPLKSFSFISVNFLSIIIFPKNLSHCKLAILVEIISKLASLKLIRARQEYTG